MGGMEATDMPIRPTAASALALASAALRDALLDAEMGNWRTTESTYDAAVYVLHAARILPGREMALRQDAEFPLLVWNPDNDGWEPAGEVRAAIRGDVAVARALVEQFGLAAVR